MRILFLFISCFGLSAKAQFLAPARGFTSWLPAASWEQALLSGNGEMGAMVMGQPHDETIILSHAALYLPQRRSANLIDQGAKLDSIRALLLAGKWQEAAQLPVRLRQQAAYTNERDPFIPAFDIRIHQEASNVKRYQRSVNFETGEAIVDWEDDRGIFQRRLFVSRSDSLIVLSIKGTAPLNMSIEFDRRTVEWMQWNFVNQFVKESAAAIWQDQWLHYHSMFTYQHPGAVHGYEGLGRVVCKGGRLTRRGTALVVENAKELLLLVKVLPVYEQTITPELKRFVSTTLDYKQLLARHVVLHAELFNRVKLRLPANENDRRLNAEALLLKARDSVPLALVERAFDAGRYNIISATGFYPPNLQGIWTGTWTSPWAGGMTNDGNLPVAISMNLPGNMPELMEAYFRYHEKLLPDYRRAAQRLFHCRGIHIPAQQTTTGLDTDFNETWCLSFWTGAAGWAAHYFWDYYQYTRDTGFLRSRAYPFMKEAAQFYEDFLVKDADGKLQFNPSYSPENNPRNTSSQAAINSSMDIAIANQLLKSCIEAARSLHTDTDKIGLWQSILQNLPAYEVFGGTLREWNWPGLEENPDHRHVSQLYAFFDERPDVISSRPELRGGAIQVLQQKLRFRRSEDGGEMAFGLVHLGLIAAHLDLGEEAWQCVKWLSSKYWSPGMGSYHNVNALFNTDISGGLPYLISQMLVYSEPGKLLLFPALPKEWKEGSMEGLLLRGGIKLKKLEWNNNRVKLLLHTSLAQQLTIALPFRTTITKAVNVNNRQNEPSQDGFQLGLPANTDVSIELKKLVN